nr:enhancer of rudimentary homolog isoform X1 [Vicugna pacos]
MAETESVSALAAGTMSASMVQKAFSRCASDDFRRFLSRGLAVGGVAAKLVCGGGVGSGCSERVWRDAQACCCPAFQVVGRPPLPAAETLGLALGPGARVRPAVARPPAGSCEACGAEDALSPDCSLVEAGMGILLFPSKLLL